MFAVPLGVGLRRLVQQAHQAFDDVVDIGEIALVLAMVEQLQRRSRDNGLGEADGRHIRPAPGTVHGEEAQPRAGNAEQMAVGMGHQFVGFLGRGIQRQRVVDVVAHRVRGVLVGAVHRTGGGIQQMLHRVGPATFENIQEGVDIAAGIGARVAQ
ncbi:hypothetical protein D3C77_555650 [compost metagenome]